MGNALEHQIQKTQRISAQLRSHGGIGFPMGPLRISWITGNKTPSDDGQIRESRAAIPRRNHGRKKCRPDSEIALGALNSGFLFGVRGREKQKFLPHPTSEAADRERSLPVGLPLDESDLTPPEHTAAIEEKSQHSKHPKNIRFMRREDKSELNRRGWATLVKVPGAAPSAAMTQPSGPGQRLQIPCHLYV